MTEAKTRKRNQSPKTKLKYAVFCEGVYGPFFVGYTYAVSAEHAVNMVRYRTVGLGSNDAWFARLAQA